MSQLINSYNSKGRKEKLISKLIKLMYAIVMLGSAALILILFEEIVPLNIYFVYLAVGIILGLSVIIILHIFTNNGES